MKNNMRVSLGASMSPSYPKRAQVMKRICFQKAKAYLGRVVDVICFIRIVISRRRNVSVVRDACQHGQGSSERTQMLPDVHVEMQFYSFHLPVNIQQPFGVFTCKYLFQRHRLTAFTKFQTSSIMNCNGTHQCHKEKRNGR